MRSSVLDVKFLMNDKVVVMCEFYLMLKFIKTGSEPGSRSDSCDLYSPFNSIERKQHPKGNATVVQTPRL